MLVYQRVRDDICKLSDMRIWCEFQNLGSKAWKWLNTELAGNLSLLTFWYKSDKLMLCVPSIHHIWEVGVLCEKRSLNNKTTKPNQHHCSLVFFLFNFSLANCNASPTSKYTEMNLKWYLFPIFVEMSHCISHFNRPKNIHSKSYHDKSPGRHSWHPTETTHFMYPEWRFSGSCGIFGDFFLERKTCLQFFWGKISQKISPSLTLSLPLKFNMDNYQELPCFKGVTFFQTTLFPSGIQSRTLERVPMKQHGLKTSWWPMYIYILYTAAL